MSKLPVAKASPKFKILCGKNCASFFGMGIWIFNDFTLVLTWPCLEFFFLITIEYKATKVSSGMQVWKYKSEIEFLIMMRTNGIKWYLNPTQKIFHLILMIKDHQMMLHTEFYQFWMPLFKRIMGFFILFSKDKNRVIKRYVLLIYLSFWLT